MGIKPEGTQPVEVPPDNVQTRWGDWQADLEDAGDVAGEVVLESWQLADSANEMAVDLRHRTDLLEGVQGYAHAYMSRNVNAEWAFGDNWRMMPFDAQVGPSLGASVRSDGRVVMGSAGLWLVFVKVHGRQTGFTGSGAVTLRVRVFRPNGNFHTETYTRGTSLIDSGAIGNTKGPVSLISVFPVVVDVPDCYVRVDAWTGSWRWWDGGTRLSSLSVLKQSNNTENPGEPDVPDEDESEAGT